MSSSRIDSLKKFLEAEPGDTFAHYAIGLEYASLQELQPAIEKFEEVITLDPNYVPAYHQLGLLFAKVNRKIDALKILEKGIEIAALCGDTHAKAEMAEAIDELGVA